MRGKEHPKRARRCSTDNDDQWQGSSGTESSHAKDNEEEASETSSLPAAATMTPEEKKGACHDQDRFEFSDALLARLSEIRASATRFVDMNRLHSSDVRDNQNRLQLPARSPISQILTDAEKARARTSDGMPVTAFDRRGRQYEMTCKLWKDKHYRFMGLGWKSFLQAHHLTIAKEAHLTRSVTVKLWAFRSRALLLPKEVKDNDGEKEKPGHPTDGALGLVLLLLDEGEQDEVAGDSGEEEVARDESNVRKFMELMAAVALWLLWTRDDD